MILSTTVDSAADTLSSAARFAPRGALSARLLDEFARSPERAPDTLDGLSDRVADALDITDDILRDDDLQLSLFILHGLHYGGVVDADDDWEWHPSLVSARVAIEREFERALWERVTMPRVPAPHAEEVAAALFEYTAPTAAPSVARFIAKKATREQALEYVILRSVYTLKEADPQSFGIARLSSGVKAALMEIQADEYGGGRPERMHSEIYARLMRDVGLDDTYGAYVDRVPALTLASFNLMGMFGLNRRLRGAMAGHYAAYEMTSSIPNKLLGDGFRRLGYGPDITDYFDEHVEADAVHEQIAGRDLAGGLAEQEPHLVGDVMFGAAASTLVDGAAAHDTLTAWQDGRSALRSLDSDVAGESREALAPDRQELAS